MERRMKKFSVLFEIFLVISIVIITPYDLSNLFGNNVVSAVDPMKIVNTIQNFMNDEKNKINTCAELVDGSRCQQMPASSCNALCKSGCVEGKREEVPECKLGTCIDEEEGICSPRTPVVVCNEGDGTFDERELENIPECRKKCCLIGSEARFVTEKQCDVLAKVYETETKFDASITSEPACIFLSVGDAEGACVFESVNSSEKSDCKRTTLKECNSMNGNFHERMLCSNSDLKTKCEKQQSVGCIQGVEEVYWMDSCGNKENIFDSEKSKSWNEGLILDKNDSCKIGTSSDWLAHQQSCGNCNRFTGSLCGNITDEKKLSGNPEGDAICKDLACDVNGTRRENGETWCVYQNAIGTSLDVPLIGALGYFTNFHLNGLHSMSAPGGRHFRQSCVEGEVVTEPCADYRNEVCTESRLNKTEDSSKYFSVASCRPNMWAECLNYNKNGGGPLSDLLSQFQPIIDIFPQAGKILAGPAQLEKFKVANLMFRCESNPDCYVNSVNVDKDYKFPLCLPKYPPGFYSHDAEGEDQSICGFGNQRCMSVWVYESTAFTFAATAHWECKAGCNCVDGTPPKGAKGEWTNVYPSQKLAQQSQDICVSLGDCGKKANYKGEGGISFNSGYKFKINAYDGMPKEEPEKKPREVSRPILFGVDDSKPIPGKYIDADYGGLFGEVTDGDSGGGGDEGEESGGVGPGAPSFKPADTMTASLALGGVTGATALGMGIAMKAGAFTTTTTTTIPGAGTIAPTYVQIEGSWLVDKSGVAATQPATTTTTSVSPTAVAFQAASMGAAIGAAVVLLLVGISGIGAGVGTGGTIAYGAGGAIGGAMIGTTWAASSAASAVATQAAGQGTATASQIAMNTFASAHPAFMGAIKVLGPVVMIIVIADIIVQWMAGVGDIKTVEAVFECGLWQPPKGSETSCDKCGEDGLPCSRYSCESLGKDCEFAGESEGVQGEEGTNLCIYNPRNDVSGPIITNITKEALTNGFEYANEELGKASSSFEIEKKDADGKCVNQMESFGFGFEINEHGECKYSYEQDKNFSEMTQFGNNLLSKKHSDVFSMTEVPFEGDEKKDVTMYIRCRDYSSGEEGGNIGAENFVKFCIDPVDLTPPVVVSSDDGRLLKHGIKNYTIRVEFNEDVSEARLGFTDAPYDELEYAMTCSGKVCSVDVPLNPGTNNYYVKAKDLKGNVNEQGTKITIVESAQKLVISSVSPDNETIETGDAATSVDMEITTEGGYDGTASCTFSINNGLSEFFKETGGETHKQTFSRLTPGTYNFEFLCVDKASNEASEKTKLVIKRDSVYPEITRVYDESGTLTVITKEDATCSYTNANCNFNSDESSLMDGSGAIHTTSLDYDVEYFIKCRDKHGNEPGECSIVVKGSEF